MNENHHVFLHPKRAEIAKTLYALCQSSLTDCYTARVHQNLASADTTYETVHDAIRTFEDHGWITRPNNQGRTKPITLTDTGEEVFNAVITLMEVLVDETTE
jgi:predicted transcriptional regulator